MTLDRTTLCACHTCSLVARGYPGAAQRVGDTGAARTACSAITLLRSFTSASTWQAQQPSRPAAMRVCKHRRGSLRPRAAAALAPYQRLHQACGPRRLAPASSPSPSSAASAAPMPSTASAAAPSASTRSPATAPSRPNSRARWLAALFHR